ncbi:Putative ribonuclease H protein At1g65750 [Linum perenne]
MIPSCDQLGDDSISWGLETSGRFSVKTAYLLVNEIVEDGNNTTWKKVWTWEGPAKIKHFMWLVTHGKLITNEERRCRHISPDATCTECLDPCESVEHVIRRCRLAQDVWRELLPSAIIGNSAINAFLDWWIAGIDYKPNRILFGVTSWLLWHRRNRLVFHNEKMSVLEICGQVKFWTHLYSSSWKALQVSREAPGLARKGSTDWVAAGRGGMVFFEL